MFKSASLLAQSSDPDPGLYDSAIPIVAAAHGNAIIGNHQASLFHSLSSSLSAICQDWKAHQIDAQLQPGYDALTTSFVRAGKVDIPSTLSLYQNYVPSVTENNLQTLQNAAATATDSDIYGVIVNLKYEGMASYLQAASNMAASAAYNLQSPLASASMLSEPDFRLPPQKNPGCGGVSAKFSSLVSVALSILRYMANGISDLGIGPLAPFEMGFWGPFLAIAGLGFFG